MSRREVDFGSSTYNKFMENGQGIISKSKIGMVFFFHFPLAFSASTFSTVITTAMFLWCLFGCIVGFGVIK
jgi:hypothetical protein